MLRSPRRFRRMHGTMSAPVEVPAHVDSRLTVRERCSTVSARERLPAWARTACSNMVDAICDGRLCGRRESTAARRDRARSANSAPRWIKCSAIDAARPGFRCRLRDRAVAEFVGGKEKRVAPQSISGRMGRAAVANTLELVVRPLDRGDGVARP